MCEKREKSCRMQNIFIKNLQPNPPKVYLEDSIKLNVEKLKKLFINVLHH